MNNTAPENGQPLGVLDRLIVGMNALGSGMDFDADLAGDDGRDEQKFLR